MNETTADIKEKDLPKKTSEEIYSSIRIVALLRLFIIYFQYFHYNRNSRIFNLECYFKKQVCSYGWSTHVCGVQECRPAASPQAIGDDSSLPGHHPTASHRSLPPQVHHCPHQQLLPGCPGSLTPYLIAVCLLRCTTAPTNNSCLAVLGL